MTHSFTRNFPLRAACRTSLWKAAVDLPSVPCNCRLLRVEVQEVLRVVRKLLRVAKKMIRVAQKLQRVEKISYALNTLQFLCNA